MNPTDRNALDLLDARLRAMLPEEYQDRYDDVQPVSMGSAGLKYDLDGRVAWDEMWATFCDLAMAGGPPHKGTLLEPATPAAIDAQPDRHDAVVREICRGVMMVTELVAKPSPIRGWIRVACLNEAMAGWLLRAIVMENVAVRREGATIDLPAGPHFRLEKEIKNVITVVAKTCHYWTGHMAREQHRAIADLFATLAEECPLVEPAPANDDAEDEGRRIVLAEMAARIERDTGLRASPQRDRGWLGVECPTVRAAIWMMRALVVCNVLARREGSVLFVPINPVLDPDGDTVAAGVVRVHRLAAVAGAA
jgi:hypothetical protein